MKKYIYGVVFAAAVVACFIFFVRPPETGDRLAPVTLSVTFRIPEGFEFIEGAPAMLTWQAESPGGARTVPVADKSFDPRVSPCKLVVMPPSGSAAVVLNARLYYCHKTDRMCFQNDFQTRVPLNPENPSAISRVWDITPKPENG